jgi:hypothetical protein
MCFQGNFRKNFFWGGRRGRLINNINAPLGLKVGSIENER